MLANNLAADRGRDQRSRCSQQPCRLATHSPRNNGLGSRTFCRPTGPDRWRMIDASSMPSCTAPRRASHGATYRSASGRGRACSTDSTTGRAATSGTSSSRLYSTRSTRQGRSSTPPTSARTKTRRAEGGDPVQCSGPLSRRFFYQAPCDRRHRRPAALRHDHPGAAARVDRRRGAPRLRGRARGHSRCWLRRRPHRLCSPPEGNEAGHLLQPNADEEAAPLQAALQVAVPRRGVLS